MGTNAKSAALRCLSVWMPVDTGYGHHTSSMVHATAGFGHGTSCWMARTGGSWPVDVGTNRGTLAATCDFGRVRRHLP
jgi:hypothetical protein